MTHDDVGHTTATHYLLTGYKPTPVVEYPSYGSVAAKLRQADGVMPSHVAIPKFKVGGGRLTGHGYLPTTYAPFSVGGDPAKRDFRVANLDFFPGVDDDRADRRRNFLRQLDQFAKKVDGKSADELAELSSNPQFQQAYQLATSHDAKQAFRLDDEPQKVRARYGLRTIGQSCLLARRLIERGVSFVTVNNPGWDTHERLYTRLKEGYTGAKVPVGLVPSLDLALSALVEDLVERGMFDETLIVVMGEFGRTPKLNTAAGRDHWPRVFSVLMAGAGIPGGQIIGASDATGEGPARREVTPSDLAATIYMLLGIDPRDKLMTSDGRPVEINRDGTALEELVG